MQNKELLFSPQTKARLKKSPLYTASLVSQTFTLSIRVLMALHKSTDPVATVDKYLNLFWRSNFESTHTSLYVAGKEHLTPGETYVFMSNHESWMDIPALFGAVPPSLRMVTKVGLTQLPIFGHAVLAAGFIAIDRQNRVKAIRQLERAKDRFDEGISIWMAPEGTRSRTQAILPFKKGGFHLARDLKKSIVPVYIEGAAKVMPADSVQVYPNQAITVHFCPPVSTDNVDNAHITDLMEKVRSAIVNKQNECAKNLT